MTLLVDKKIERAKALTQFVLVANHVIGVIGINHPVYHNYFEAVSWINLLLSFILVLSFHQNINRNFFVFSLFSFITGMAVEIVGVKTSVPFGTYYYTKTLGYNFLGVPLIIGINWVLLSYVLATTTDLLKVKKNSKVVIAALGMTLIDIMLEPFAIRHNFWVWATQLPPVQNYLAWFAVAVVIQIVFRKFIPENHNKVALSYLFILVLFLFADAAFAFV